MSILSDLQKQTHLDNTFFILQIAMNTGQHEHSMATYETLLEFIKKHEIQAELSTIQVCCKLYHSQIEDDRRSIKKLNNSIKVSANINQTKMIMKYSNQVALAALTKCDLLIEHAL